MTRQRTHAALVGLATAFFSLSPAAARATVPPPLQPYMSQTAHGYRNGNARAVPEQPWWTAFKEQKKLRGLIEQALRTNFDLGAATARIVQAEALATQARAPLFPSLSVNLSVQASPLESVGFQFGGAGPSPGGPGPELPDVFYSGSAVLNARYGLDVWGRQYLQYRASELTAVARRMNRDEFAARLAVQVAEAYFDAVATAQQKAITKQQIDVNASLLELTQLRFEKGEASSLDVYQQRQQLAAAEARLPPIKANLRVFKQRLNVLVGNSPSESLVAVPDTLPQLPEPPGTGRPRDLLQNRPTLRAARAQYEAAVARRKSSVRALFPSMSIGGQAGWQAVKLDELNSQQFWGANASISLPLFQGLRNWGRIEQNAGAATEAAQTLGQQWLQAVRDVESALVQQQERRRELDAVRQQLEAARLAYQKARERYAKGLVDYLPLLTALNTRQSAELTLIRAKRALLSARLRLYQALGGTWIGDLTGDVS